MPDQKLNDIATVAARWWVGQTTEPAAVRAFGPVSDQSPNAIGPDPLDFSRTSLLYSALQPKLLDIAKVFVDAAVPLAERGELGTHPLQFDLKTDYEPQAVRLPGAQLMSRLSQDKSGRWLDGVTNPLYEAAAAAAVDERFIFPMQTSMIVDVVSGVVHVRGENINNRTTNVALMRSEDLQKTATDAISWLNKAVGPDASNGEARANFDSAIDKLTAHYMEHPAVRRAAERRVENGKLKRPEADPETHLMSAIARLNALGFVVGISRAHADGQRMHAKSTNSGLENFDGIPKLSRDASRDVAKMWSTAAKDVNHHFGLLSDMRVPISPRGANPMTHTGFDL